MRKKLLSMVMAGTLALSFTACGGSSSGETEKSTDTSKVEETSSGDTQAASADSGNKKTITVWVEKIFSDDANTKMEERLKEYGKEKNVTVNCEMVAATDFVTKLNAAIEAGQSVPDIISADTTKVLNYYPNIPCNDVTDLVDQIDEIVNGFGCNFGIKLTFDHTAILHSNSNNRILCHNSFLSFLTEIE